MGHEGLLGAIHSIELGLESALCVSIFYSSLLISRYLHAIYLHLPYPLISALYSHHIRVQVSKEQEVPYLFGH